MTHSSNAEKRTTYVITGDNITNETKFLNYLQHLLGSTHPSSDKTSSNEVKDNIYLVDKTKLLDNLSSLALSDASSVITFIVDAKSEEDKDYAKILKQMKDKSIHYTQSKVKTDNADKFYLKPLSGIRHFESNEHSLEVRHNIFDSNLKEYLFATHSKSSNDIDSVEISSAFHYQIYDIKLNREDLVKLTHEIDALAYLSGFDKPDASYISFSKTLRLNIPK